MRRTARGAPAVICVSALLLAAAMAQAQSPADRSVDDYRNATRRAVHACGKGIPEPGSSGAAYDAAATADCVAGAKASLAEKFDAAMTSTMDPAVRAALQRHQAAFFSSLSGLAPLPGEAATSYRQRQAGLRCALSHAWTDIEQSEAEDRFKSSKAKP